MMSSDCARRLRCWAFATWMALSALVAAHADAEWATPTRELARKISGITGPEAVGVDVTNQSSLPAARADAIRIGLLAELASLGVRVVSPEKAGELVHVTLSENIREFVWVAEIRQGTQPKVVVLVMVARTSSPSAATAPASVQIRKQLLLTQEDRILDVATWEGGGAPKMAVLDAAKLTLYKADGGHWQRERDWAVPHAKPWPRDLRGLLVPESDQRTSVYLPGVFCGASWRGSGSLECWDREEAWPLDRGLRTSFNSTRNSFTGALSPGVGKFSAVPAFYSAARLPRGRGDLWLFVATDGSVHAVDGLSDQMWSGVAWGSDIASVHTSCGSGWQVIADSKIDSGYKDELRVYELRDGEIADREMVAVGAPLSLNGRVTALWAHGENEAVVVLRNEEGQYEAYRLLFACGD